MCTLFHISTFLLLQHSKKNKKQDVVSYIVGRREKNKPSGAIMNGSRGSNTELREKRLLRCCALAPPHARHFRRTLCSSARSYCEKVFLVAFASSADLQV